jgi:hypothetical protein
MSACAAGSGAAERVAHAAARVAHAAARLRLVAGLLGLRRERRRVNGGGRCRRRRRRRRGLGAPARLRQVRARPPARGRRARARRSARALQAAVDTGGGGARRQCSKSGLRRGGGTHHRARAAEVACACTAVDGGRLDTGASGRSPVSVTGFPDAVPPPLFLRCVGATTLPAASLALHLSSIMAVTASLALAPRSLAPARRAAGISAAAPARRGAAARGKTLVTAATATPFDALKFAPIRESEVSRAMSSR